MLSPGLIDLRVKTGEPGAEPKETLKSASRAAAAGGVTSIVVQPDTDPSVDDPAMVDFILRRARDIELVNVYPAGASTCGCKGERLTEIGLMREAGAVYFTNGDQPIVNSRVFRRILTYAKAFGALAGGSIIQVPSGLNLSDRGRVRSACGSAVCAGGLRAHHAGARPRHH